jgi:hypothetical protein
MTLAPSELFIIVELPLEGRIVGSNDEGRLAILGSMLDLGEHRR